jgi:hypothetical protein
VRKTRAQTLYETATFLNTLEELAQLDSAVSRSMGRNLGPSVSKHTHRTAVIISLNMIERDTQLNEALKEAPLRALPVHPDILQEFMELKEELVLPQQRSSLQDATKVSAVPPAVQCLQEPPIGIRLLADTRKLPLVLWGNRHLLCVVQMKEA